LHFPHVIDDRLLVVRLELQPLAGSDRHCTKKEMRFIPKRISKKYYLLVLAGAVARGAVVVGAGNVKRRLVAAGGWVSN